MSAALAVGGGRTDIGGMPLRPLRPFLRAGLLALLALGAGGLAFSVPAAAQSGVAACPDFAPARVTLDMQVAPLRTDYSQSIRQLAQKPGRRPGAGRTANAHTLGLAAIQYNQQWQVNVVTASLGQGRYCGAAQVLTVSFGYDERTVYVARELPKGSCIHAEVLEKGYDPSRNSFTQSYGSRELDASLLLIPHTGFLPVDDPRVVGTIEAVERELMYDGFLMRYPIAQENSVDGLTGGEGAFLACSFWLAEARAMVGRRREAVELFERLLALRNDVGLLAEEYDPRYGRQVGNFPQAFSHVPLVHTAHSLSRDDPRPRQAHLFDETY